MQRMRPTTVMHGFHLTMIGHFICNTLIEEITAPIRPATDPALAYSSTLSFFLCDVGWVDCICLF
jgi:hypothetical protein